MREKEKERGVSLQVYETTSLVSRELPDYLRYGGCLRGHSTHVRSGTRRVEMEIISIVRRSSVKSKFTLSLMSVLLRTLTRSTVLLISRLDI